MSNCNSKTWSEQNLVGSGPSTRHPSRRKYAGHRLLSASTLVAFNFLPGIGNAALSSSGGESVTSASEATLGLGTAGQSENEKSGSLALIIKPEKEKPRGGGEGEKPKRRPVEKRAVVSVHG